MRLTSTFLLPALCWRLASAVESAARIYVYDPQQPEPRPSRSLSPVAARLVLAQRFGVEDFHSADLFNEEVIKGINDYGSRTHLFGDQRNEAIGRMMIYAEEDKDGEYLEKTFSDYFTITPEPSSQSADELWNDLKTQQASEPAQDGDFGWLKYPSDIKSAVEHAKGEGNALTILYLPPTPREFGAGDEWGSYRMPSATSLLRKRDDKKEPKEQSDTKPVESSTSPLTLEESSRPRILPACFPSEDSCTKFTGNCTGRGKCQLKYTDISSDPKKDCYTCQCEATTSKSSDGKTLTTYWGGPSCQKQDVSVQFWLIALFSITMVGLISFAVGQIWSMGDEPLPSVIGAGVTGPVARK